MEIRLEALTSPEARKRQQDGVRVAVLPVGSVEQHGPHGPLGTDTYIAQVISKGVAEKLNGLCLPPVWFGISQHHMNLAGSLCVRPEIFSGYLEDIIDSLAVQGFTDILVLNGHGGNTGSINNALVNVREKHKNLFLAQSSVWLALHDVYDTLPDHVRQKNWRTMISHAGLFESAVVMAVEDGLVKLDQARAVSNDPYVQASDPAMTLTAGFDRISRHGFGGDPTPATAELGRMFIDLSVQAIVAKYNVARSLLEETES